MRLLIILLFVAAAAIADVEIAPVSSNSDLSFVSWIGTDGFAHLGRYEGDSLVTEITTVGDYDASVGVCEFQPDSCIVLFVSSTYLEYCDTLRTLSSSTLSQLDSWPMDRWHDHCRYSFLKNPDTRWDAFLAIYGYSFCSSITTWECISMELSVSASGEVDSLFSLSYSQYMDGGRVSDQYNSLSFFGPASDETNWPMFCTSVIQPGNGGWPSATLFSSFVHNPPADSTELLTEYFYGAYDTLPQYPPTMMALGSCSDKALLLWEDAYGEVFYSDFNCISPEPVTTVTYPWSQPDENNSCAMSSNPDDTGMLLAWYQSGVIRCRHYQDEWNGFEHIAVSGVGVVGEFNIAVSSVDDGYWIAWLENGATEPELIFVDRSTVTGIEEGGSSGSLDATIDLFPNPCIQDLSISTYGIPHSASVRVLIHDCSGRLVRRINPNNQIQDIYWDCCDQSGERCEQGIYFVTLIGSGCSVTEKALLLD